MRSNLQEMLKHFSSISKVYRNVRTLDYEPIYAIKMLLKNHGYKKGKTFVLDVGAGTGRYTELFIQAVGKNKTYAVLLDISPEMLLTARECLKDYKTSFVNSLAERLPFKNETFDVILVFNAIHHFDRAKFIREAWRVLRPGGFIFIYTRTQEQNRNTIWGKFFPGFAEKETRLFYRNELLKFLGRLKKFKLLDIIEFRYQRRSALSELLRKAFVKHYSTFYFYSEDEFAEAVEIFKEKLIEHYGNPEEIVHTDENTLIALMKN